MYLYDTLIIDESKSPPERVRDLRAAFAGSQPQGTLTPRGFFDRRLYGKR
jgi:hypothetical protein